MDREAPHSDNTVKLEPLDPSSCFPSPKWDGRGISPNVYRCPLLVTEQEMRFPSTDKDLYVCDHNSWHLISSLLNLVQEPLMNYLQGIAIACLIMATDDSRFAWILQQSASLQVTESTYDANKDEKKFHWFLIPQKLRPLMESYVACISLHIGRASCNLVAPLQNEWFASSASKLMEINLVMNAERDLEFFGNQCLHLSMDAGIHSVKYGKNIHRVPDFLDYPLQVITVEWAIGDRCISFLHSKGRNGVQADLSSNMCSDVEDGEVLSNDSTTTASESATIDVEEMDLKCLELKEHVEELQEGEAKQEHYQHVLRITQRSSKGNVTRKVLQFGELLDIAKNYADLFRSRCNSGIPSSFQLNSFKGPSVIFECPECNIPSRYSSHSALLSLLRHVSKRHHESFNVLMTDIIEKYSPFILRMIRKINERCSKTYLKKLRNKRRLKSLK